MGTRLLARTGSRPLSARLASHLAASFEPGPASSYRQLPIDGLRGIAAGLVFLVHYCSLVRPWIAESWVVGLADAVGMLGNAGVELFFVLSGYLIYDSLMRRRWQFVPYFGRRIRRLYPTFLVVLLIYLLLSAAVPQESRVPEDPIQAAQYIVANLLLLPGVLPITPIITVAWTLSYEAAFYLVVPFLVAGLGLRTWRRPARVTLLLLLAIATQLLPLPHSRAGMFACGMLLAEALPWINARRVPEVNLAALSAMPVCVALLLLGVPNLVAFCALFIACFLLCASALSGAGLVAKTLAAPPLRWLGAMSYSFYLLHGLALKATFISLAIVWPADGQEPALFWLLLPLAFGAALAGAACLFLAVERLFSLRIPA